MKRKLEDKLAMLAFGDFEPEESERLKAELGGNAEALGVLAEYREMRAALKALGEVPEHQLSSQRLRHAVLNGGLKPKSRPQLGWLWMPTTAFAIALGLVFIRDANRQVRLVNVPLRTVAVAAPPVALPGSDFALASGTAQILSVEHPAPRMIFASHRRSSRDRERALVASLKQKVDAELAAGMAATGGFAKVWPKTTHSTPDSGTIVLIGTAKDSNTGAQKATEVDSADNVIVGG